MLSALSFLLAVAIGLLVGSFVIGMLLNGLGFTGGDPGDLKDDVYTGLITICILGIMAGLTIVGAYYIAGINVLTLF